MKFSWLSLCLKVLLWVSDTTIKGFICILFFFSRLLSVFLSQNYRALTKTRNCSKPELLKQDLDCTQTEVKVCKEDVVLVMERIGVSFEWGGDGTKEILGVQEIEKLFENDGATMAEVEEAFDVFDQNKDGFIESRELQRVLFCLGLEKDLMDCQRMINVVDQNGDGLIDHNEFVRILEQSFG